MTAVAALAVTSCDLLENAAPTVGASDVSFSVSMDTVKVTRYSSSIVAFSMSATYTNHSTVSIFLLGGNPPFYDFERRGDDARWHPMGLVWTGYRDGDLPRVEVRPGESVRMELTFDGPSFHLSDGNRFGEYTFTGAFRLRVWPSLQRDRSTSSDALPESAQVSKHFYFDERYAS